jgi:hypothetical protein
MEYALRETFPIPIQVVVTQFPGQAPPEKFPFSKISIFIIA